MAVEAVAPVAVHAAAAPVAPRARGDGGSKQIQIDLERPGFALAMLPRYGKDHARGRVPRHQAPLITNVTAADAQDRHRNLIMVTSSLPAEGKSFCPESGAEYCHGAIYHRDVGGCRRGQPSVLNNLGLRAERGLMDMLLDPNVQVGDVLLKTNIDKFSILPVNGVTSIPPNCWRARAWCSC